MSRKFFASILPPMFLLVALVFGQGCGMPSHLEKMDRNTERMAQELEGYRKYVAELNESIRSLAQNLALLQLTATSTFNALLKQLFAEQPPAKTPDIDDILGGATTPQSTPKDTP